MEPLKHLLFIDIETASGEGEYAAMSEGMQREWAIKSGGKYPGEEDVAKTFWDKAGIFAEFGKIVCISMGCLHERGGEWKLMIRSFRGEDEGKILGQFCESIGRFQEKHANLTFVGHNIKEFDLPFISRRMIIHGMGLPKCLKLQGKKPWEIPHIDTMELWAFGDRKAYTKLSLLAEVLGIPTPKDDICGSDVTRVFWEEGGVERIATYCQKDVETTARIFMRLMCYEEVAFEVEIFGMVEVGA